MTLTNPLPVDRAKAVSEISRDIISSAKVELECRFCHTITTNVVYVPIVARKRLVVAVDLFDFEEGNQVSSGR